MKKTMITRHLPLTLIMCFVVTTVTAQERSNDIQKLGEEAYVYGLQQVIFYGQRYIYTQNDNDDNQSYVGTNRFSWVRKKITPDFPIVTPNATTLYGIGYLDLQKEPLVIEMPQITDRYFSLQIMDQYGIYYLYAGNQFNGTAARKYLIVPDGYEGKLPGDFVTTDVITAPTKTSFAIVRIAVMTGTDQEIRKINGWQDQITITPMSKWVVNGKQGIAQANASVVPGDYKTFPRLPKIVIGQVDVQTAEDFFTILSLVLNDSSMPLMKDSKLEAAMLERLKAIGMGPGLDFQWSRQGPQVQAALTTGFKNGYKKVKTATRDNLLPMNGWMVVRNKGGFATGWLDRAVMADAGWGGPDRNISHGGAFLFVDADGKQLNGNNKYTITFNLDEQPPVSQFWSIPVYNSKGYFVANEINRYTINSFMLKRRELHAEDGKLVIYLQKDKPTDAIQLKNWLPAPAGDFRFAARFYGPKMPLVDGSYKMPRPVKTK